MGPGAHLKDDDVHVLFRKNPQEKYKMRKVAENGGGELKTKTIYSYKRRRGKSILMENMHT